MDIFEFEMILEDTFEMDYWLPVYCKKNILSFKEVSYSQAAIKELIEFVRERLGDEKQSIEDYIYVVGKYIELMTEFAGYNAKNSLIFVVASAVGMNVQDILKSMV